jgi:hypothetical protein
LHFHVGLIGIDLVKNCWEVERKATNYVFSSGGECARQRSVKQSTQRLPSGPHPEAYFTTVNSPEHASANASATGYSEGEPLRYYGAGGGEEIINAKGSPPKSKAEQSYNLAMLVRYHKTFEGMRAGNIIKVMGNMSGLTPQWLMHEPQVGIERLHLEVLHKRKVLAMRSPGVHAARMGADLFRHLLSRRMDGFVSNKAELERDRDVFLHTLELYLIGKAKPIALFMAVTNGLDAWEGRTPTFARCRGAADAWKEDMERGKIIWASKGPGW